VAKFVPRLLTDDQREQLQTIARDLFEHSCEDVQFLKNSVTGDESWVYGYDPETKQQEEGSHVSATEEGAPGAKQNMSCYWHFFILRVSYTTSMLPMGN